MLIRAGASNRVMLGALGVNIAVLYTFVFARGAALAGPIFTVEVRDGRECADLGPGSGGALFANLTLFVSPSILHWTRSGEIMMMVILGGIGTLIGPVFGAAAYLLLESVLSRWTEHWPALLGPLLIVIVLCSKSGLLGLLGIGRGIGRDRDG